nr:hypothetical protein [Tanacetum cinerariifolium]
MALLSRSQRHQYLRHRMIWRRFILSLGLHTTEEMKTTRDPMLRLCHMLIACSIAERSQALEKVTLTDLFYLRGMDVGLINVLYMLARDPMMRLCHMLIACSIAGRSQALEKVTLTDLFYLRGMDVGSINVLYMLARPKTKEAVGYCGWCLKAAKDAPTVDEGALADLTPMKAPQPPYAALRLCLRGLRGSRRRPKTKEAVGYCGWCLKAAKDAPTVDEGALADLTPMKAPQPPYAALRLCLRGLRGSRRRCTSYDGAL